VAITWKKVGTANTAIKLEKAPKECRDSQAGDNFDTLSRTRNRHQGTSGENEVLYGKARLQDGASANW
jgi:hypothetical protein